ncbi:MAG TPA: hypothetical protein VEC16_00405 [Alphaproteobacteria bacterium]|nr:hypothetical protein [Alphaproteobacteria bacterium]
MVVLALVAQDSSIKIRNLKEKLNNVPIVEYVNINKDSISDIVVQEKKNNSYFVMLSNPDGTYEKTNFQSSIDAKHLIYSKRDNGQYEVYTTSRNGETSFETGKFIPCIDSCNYLKETFVLPNK